MKATITLHHEIDVSGPYCGACPHLVPRRLETHGYSPSAYRCRLFGDELERVYGRFWRCVSCLAACGVAS